MFKALLYKWFGIEELPCKSCEVLHQQLDRVTRERDEILHKLFWKDNEPKVPESERELEPLRTTSHIPWRVRQQILEAEDRKKFQLMQEKKKEMEAAQSKGIEKLEEELGIKDAS